VALSIGFVLINRYNNGSHWDGLVDLLLLVVGCPVALLSLGVAAWVAGKHISLALFGISATGVALIVGLSIYNEREATKLSLVHQAARRADLEAKYGAKCAKEKDSENPYDYLVCLEVQEQNAKKSH
jgi:hypothetical protein